MTDPVVGYLVLIVPQGEFSSPATIFSKKVLFPTWEAAVNRAAAAAAVDSSPICLLRATAKEDCARWQNIKLYELSDGTIIYIQAVFAPAL
jgi:hypothetical protein